MAQPLPYERDYDFEGYQTGHPSTPLPGDKINLELDQVDETIGQILDRIARLQDDDLALKRKSVGYDQLKDELNGFGFEPPTTWATGTAYVERDTVFHDSAFYRCLVSHTAGVFATDLAAGKWDLVADFTEATSAAETAQAAAEAAQSAAETAQVGAEAAESQAITSAANAATSADSATTSATNASASAAAAAGSASDAGAFAVAAAASATAAATSEDNAAVSATDAAASASEAAATLAGAVMESNNLSDVDSASTALSNLGGMAAVNDATALKAIDTTTLTAAFRKDAKGGTFLFKIGDYSTEAAADTAEGVYVKADDVAVTAGIWVRQFEGGLDLNHFVEDSDDDYTNAVTRALALGKRIGGRGRTYEISGAGTIITLVANTDIVDALFKDMTASGDRTASQRMFYASSADNIRLSGVTMNRNGDGNSGSNPDAAAIYISGGAKHVLDFVEVYGNDYGLGIGIFDADDFELTRPYVHDIRGGSSTATAITDDSVQGIYVRGSRFRIDSPRVLNLTNEWTGQAEWNRWTRGIAVSGSDAFIIAHPEIDNVGEGIDLSGDLNPHFFQIHGGIIQNARTWGVKCANSPTYGKIIGMTAYRCGSAGFVVNGPSTDLDIKASKIDFIGCDAIATGYQYEAGGVKAGFAVLAGTDSSYPRAIRVIGCRADDDGEGNMEYGFYSNASAVPGTGDSWIEDIDLAISGASTADYYPTGIAQGYAALSPSSTETLTTGVFKDLTFDQRSGRLSTTGADNTEISIKRAGLYMIDGAVGIGGSATGRRYTQVTVESSVVASSVKSYVPTGAGIVNYPVSAIFAADAGDVVTVQAKQDSGGDLTVQTSTAITLTMLSSGRGRT